MTKESGRPFRLPGTRTGSRSRSLLNSGSAQTWRVDEFRLEKCEAMMILDSITCTCLRIALRRKLSDASVLRELERTRTRHGSPKRLVVDASPIMQSRALKSWSKDAGISLVHLGCYSLGGLTERIVHELNVAFRTKGPSARLPELQKMANVMCNFYNARQRQ